MAMLRDGGGDVCLDGDSGREGRRPSLQKVFPFSFPLPSRPHVSLLFSDLFLLPSILPPPPPPTSPVGRTIVARFPPPPGRSRGQNCARTKMEPEKGRGEVRFSLCKKGWRWWRGSAPGERGGRTRKKGVEAGWHGSPFACAWVERTTPLIFLPHSFSRTRVCTKGTGKVLCSLSAALFWVPWVHCRKKGPRGGVGVALGARRPNYVAYVRLWNWMQSKFGSKPCQ